VRWDEHTSRSAPFTVNATFLDRVEQVVGWAVQLGLPAIVNSHHDDWLDGSADDAEFEAQLGRLVSIWTQVAARLAGVDDSALAFEVYNEPHANMTLDWLNQMDAAVLPAIRKTNPTRNVLFGGLQFMNAHWIVSNPNKLSFPSDDAHVFLEVRRDRDLTGISARFD
jgi:endoglucanase